MESNNQPLSGFCGAAKRMRLILESLLPRDQSIGGQLVLLKTHNIIDKMQVKVETCVVEAEERASAVVEAARRHSASLLMLGQPRRLGVPRWLQVLWRRRRSGMVDYCIEHAPCMTMGVRRRRSGGYLVFSKHHKDFWLLA
jgi:hypothetical protein